MKYCTRNELANFVWKDSFIGEVQVTNGMFHLGLDNVTILPENSTNRDIREMRANELLFTIENANILTLIEEGYKVYDADGNLQNAFLDKEVEKDKILEVLHTFAGGNIYSLKQDGNLYVFEIDANDHTYVLNVEGTGNVEEWDRYLTKDMGF